MKKALLIIGITTTLMACNNKDHGSGAVEDRSRDSDTSAFLPSAKGRQGDGKTDSSKMEDREDLQQRHIDTTQH